MIQQKRLFVVRFSGYFVQQQKIAKKTARRLQFLFLTFVLTLFHTVPSFCHSTRLEGQEMREKIKKLIRELHSTGSVTVPLILLCV